jgi:hypothetical protein
MIGPRPPAEPSKAVTTDPPPIASETHAAPPRTDVPPDIQVPSSARPARRTTPLAIWCLVLAFGPFALAVVLAIVVRVASGSTPPSSGIFYQLVGLLAIGSFVASVVTGIIAIRRVRRSDARLKGIGLVGVGFGLIVLVIVAGALSGSEAPTMSSSATTSRVRRTSGPVRTRPCRRATSTVATRS